MEARAAYTIGLTIAAYVICYLPLILYSVFAGILLQHEEMSRSNIAMWIRYVVAYFLFLSSVCNPFIYIIRSTRFRYAIRQLIRKPCGSDDLTNRVLPGKQKNLRVVKISPSANRVQRDNILPRDLELQALNLTQKKCSWTKGSD